MIESEFQVSELAQLLFPSFPVRYMKLSFEQALIEVWRQTLVENAKTVSLGQSNGNNRV